MSTQKNHRKGTDARQTMQKLVAAKQEQAQQTPAWPGAREQAQPQHARAQPAGEEAAPRQMPQTPPSESGYERSGDVGKRHH